MSFVCSDSALSISFFAINFVTVIVGISFSFWLFHISLFQLGICKKMAKYITRTSAGCNMSSSVSVGMDGCFISSCCAYHVGMLVDCNTWSGYSWSGYNNGWNCSFIGLLFNHALVENTMAKLKYVLFWPLY